MLGGGERSLLDVMTSVHTTEPSWSLRLIAGSDGSLLTEARARGIDASVLPIPGSIAKAGDAAAGGPAGSSITLPRLLALLSGAAPALLMYGKRLGAIIAEAAPDLIHANGFKMHILAARSAPKNIPLLWHMHDYVSARLLMPRLLRTYAHRCAMIVANSNSVAADVRAVIGDHVPTVTIHNAVDLARFTPEGPVADLDRLAGMAAAPATVKAGLVATMARWKGHELFLKALSLLPRDLPVRGYVVGGPIYQSRGSQYSIDELRAIARRLGLDGRVAFTGFVDDPAAAMRALDIVIHASTEPEPFGLVIAEAMACGRPVITSCSGGAAELVMDGVDATAFQSGDAADLARKIAALAGDRAMRERMGRAGRIAAEKKFALSRLARQMCSVYAGIVNGEDVVTAALS